MLGGGRRGAAGALVGVEACTPCNILVRGLRRNVGEFREGGKKKQTLLPRPRGSGSSLDAPSRCLGVAGDAPRRVWGAASALGGVASRLGVSALLCKLVVLAPRRVATVVRGGVVGRALEAASVGAG